MAPKKAKKSKAELDAERLQKEEEDRKAKELEDKKAAELAEKQRKEELRIQEENKAFREKEIVRLAEEFASMLDIQKTNEQQYLAELKKEV